jgi:hypothetical protein
MSAEVVTFPLYDEDDNLLETFLLPKNNLSATTNPDSSNDDTEGYAPGSIWSNRTADRVFVCSDNITGNAVWKEVGDGGSGSAGSVTLIHTDGTVYLAEPTGDEVLDGEDANIGAADLVAGDIIRAKWHGNLDFTNATEFRFKVLIGTNVIEVTPYFTAPNDLDAFGFTIECLLRVVNNTGSSIEVMSNTTVHITTSAVGSNPFLYVSNGNAGYGFGYSGDAIITSLVEFDAYSVGDILTQNNFIVERLLHP